MSLMLRRWFEHSGCVDFIKIAEVIDYGTCRSEHSLFILEKRAWCLYTRNVLVTSSYRQGVRQSRICSSLTEPVLALCGILCYSVLALHDCLTTVWWIG